MEYALCESTIQGQLDMQSTQLNLRSWKNNGREKILECDL